MPINVLFLCTGNSARSIVSEALCNDLGGGAWQGYSAGSHPSGQPHPDGLIMLRTKGHDVEGYKSESWDVFSGDDAPLMDVIITVCDNAANEVCPVWPRKADEQPIIAHWPAPDPAHIEPRGARQEMFEHVYDVCKGRITALMALDMSAPRETLTVQIRAIGESA